MAESSGAVPDMRLLVDYDKPPHLRYLELKTGRVEVAGGDLKNKYVSTGSIYVMRTWVLFDGEDIHSLPLPLVGDSVALANSFTVAVDTDGDSAWLMPFLSRELRYPLDIYAGSAIRVDRLGSVIEGPVELPGDYNRLEVVTEHGWILRSDNAVAIWDRVAAPVPLVVGDGPRVNGATGSRLLVESWRSSTLHYFDLASGRAQSFAAPPGLVIGLYATFSSSGRYVALDLLELPTKIVPFTWPPPAGGVQMSRHVLAILDVDQDQLWAVDGDVYGVIGSAIWTADEESFVCGAGDGRGDFFVYVSRHERIMQRIDLDVGAPVPNLLVDSGRLIRGPNE